MQISKDEFGILLNGFWKLPEGNTDEQIQAAALIAMVVESKPEFGPALYESLRSSTTAPGFIMKAGFLKRGLSDDAEFDRWMTGLKQSGTGR